MKRAADAPADAPLVLDGEELDLKSVLLDGTVIPADPKSSREHLSYSWVEDDVLEVKGPLPAEFKLEFDVSIKPHLNTQLSGLYKSSGVYCTQVQSLKSTLHSDFRIVNVLNLGHFTRPLYKASDVYCRCLLQVSTAPSASPRAFAVSRSRKP